MLYDIIIVGAGVTGLATAMYAGRMNLKTLVLGASSDSELPVGGVITMTDVVENYPGFSRLTGPELAEKIRKHAEDYKENIAIKEEKAVKVEKRGEKGCFTITTDENTYESKTIIFATGTKVRKLAMKGAKEFENKGVSYCALCDGMIFNNKIVAVVGGSDSAAKEALLLAQYAKKVYLIHRGDKIRPEPINEKRVKQNKKIDVVLNTNIVEVKGNKFVERIVLDKPYNGKKELEMNGVFGAIGHILLSDLAKSIGVKTNEKGEIIIDHKDSSTNVAGVFAAGDVTDKEFKQAITGVAEGVTAAYSAYKHINENQLICPT